MSRRRNSKAKAGKKEVKQARSRVKGLWWKVLLGLVVIVIVGGIVAYNKAIGFLHSEDFRSEVSLQVSDELGAEGAFGDFEWDGLSAENDHYKATGIGAISAVDVKGISLDVALDYFKRDKFEISNVRIDKVEAELDLRKEFLKIEREKKPKGFLQSLLPEEVELLDAEFSLIDAAVITNSGEYDVSGVKLNVKKDNDSYRAQIEGGFVEMPFPFLSSAIIKSGDFVQSDEEIYVNDLRLKIFDEGNITINGVLDLSPRAQYLYNMKGILSGLNCKEVFPKAWHRHLNGDVEGSFKIKPYQGTEPKIEGKIVIKNGTLEALPILNKIQYYLAEPKYRTLHFQEFSSDFEKYKEEIKLKNIVLKSSGLLHIEGDLKISGESLDGLFNVGVPATYISNIPGAKTSVFKPGKDQLLWAQVRVGGSFDDITEDLSGRLIAAATDEMIRRALSMGGEILNPDTIKKLLEGVGSVEGLTDLIEGDKNPVEGGIDAMKGVIKGITGTNKEEKEDDKKGGILPDLPKTPALPELPELPELPLPFL